MSGQYFVFEEKEKKFYLINEKKSFEALFKDIVFEEGEDFAYVSINGIPVKISRNSKYVKFSGNGYNEKIFIVNTNQALFIINLFKFKNFKVKRENGTFTNGIFDDLDFNEIIYSETPLDEKEYKIVNTLIKKNDKISLDKLSLFYLDYQNYDFSRVIDGEFELSPERKDFYDKLKVLQKKRFIPIIGPKSIGKTTSLLYYLKSYWFSQYFYINLTYWRDMLAKNKYEDLLLCICKELFNYMTFSDVQKFYGIFYGKNYISAMDIILDIINYLEDLYFDKQICITIDQYKNKLDKDYKIIHQIKNIAEKDTKFIFFICSSINEFDLRYPLDQKDKFHLNYLFVNKLTNVGNKELNKLNENEKSLLKDCGELFFYFYKIKNDSKIERKSILQIRKEIVEHIIDYINKFFNKYDNKEKIDIIKYIHNNIERKGLFSEFKEKLKLFPMKYFNISVNKENMFIIDELKDNSEITINPNYPIVIDCINQIFQTSKNIISYSIINDISHNINSIDPKEFEKDFNEFLWFNRKKLNLFNCKIVEKIEISSLMEMKEDDAEIIQNAIYNCDNISDSILIVQRFQNTKHFDTAIIKYITKNKKFKYFDLYLFKQSIKKEANERITQPTLNIDKTCLKYLFFIMADIHIKDIFFSYVFCSNYPDENSINYCNELNINYILFNNDNFQVVDSQINPKIETKYKYFISPKEEKQTFIVNNLDIDYSLGKEALSEEYLNLKSFLHKKRNLEKKLPKELSEKIQKFQKIVNLENRNYDIKDQIINEYLMDKENIKKKGLAGISFLIDKETQMNLKEIEFSKAELSKLYKLMENYGENLEILKVVKMKSFPSNDCFPSYDCAIIEKVNEEKNFICMKKHKNISLKKNTTIRSISLDGDYYLIKFINKNMISKK